MRQFNETDLHEIKIAYDLLRDMEGHPDDFGVKPGTVGAVLTVRNVFANIIATNADL